MEHVRTHSCGGLREADIDNRVTLIGWVHKRRDHGKLIFIDLRDREGITQLVFFPRKDSDLMERADTLRSEFLIAVEGTVARRPKGTINDKIPTGTVEIAVEDVTVLNASKVPPFELEEEATATEEVRLAYRALDLRRPLMFRNLLMRHKVSFVTRRYLDRLGFLEVETPILTKSTPEGARDYLVPSRLNPGKFYALPQSPQLFKQLLMVAGIERYFQIARCFRDEDLRADRQPEFTQIDIEMSFITEEDIYRLVEGLMAEIFKEVLGSDLETPFPRMSYAEAMEKHGSDKPNLKTDQAPFAFLWVTEFPLFEFSEEEKRWVSLHHPFTAPHPADIPLLENDPAKVRSRAYDLVLNGVEIGSGSIRIHERALQEKIFSLIGLEDEEARQRFGFLLDAFDYGAPPHGGIAPGLDRLLALLCGCESIRDVIAFPKTQNAICPLSKAPSDVAAKQLRELHIRLA
ncbi:MAG: aspartate--tRNA ligase [Candidatus Omnitrophica bacterium]|nr:aspartate--tRNA ligase [Candidatus Omnitrophota bacterium]